jgi:hypothetical protein
VHYYDSAGKGKLNNYNLKLIMLERTAEELEQWKAEMKTYEKNKRTKKPFGKTAPSVEYVTH